MKLKFTKLHSAAVLNAPAHHGDSGFDLVSVESVTLMPGSTKVVDTGIAVSIPLGFEGQVRPRSGIAAKNTVTVLNTPGTIDHTYTGAIKVILINHSVNEPFVITPGMRIAQLVIAPIATHQCELEEVAALDETTRGDGGLGSTGT